MSHAGKMQRGKLWYGFRNLEGEYPLGIKDDANKMKDIKYFLENLKKEKETKSKGKK